MSRAFVLGCLWVLASGTACASSMPKKEAAVDEAALAQGAAAGSQVAELASLCGWEADPALVLQAKTAALMLATQALTPEKYRYEVMSRVLASNAMAGHARAARRQVGNGGCVDAGEKSKWAALRRHTLTLLATPAPPTHPASAPAGAAAPSTPPAVTKPANTPPPSASPAPPPAGKPARL